MGWTKTYSKKTAAIWLLVIAVTGAIVLVATLLATQVMNIDSMPGVHGISIGSDTHYCSIELNTGSHGGGLDFWCQTAR
jgi:hypothetical protein